MIAAQVGLDAWNGGPRRTNGNLERPRNSEMPMDVRCFILRQLSASLVERTYFTYPAIPTDCGYCRAARSPSQYTEVTCSIPSLSPSNTRTGIG